jgi:hypothetical protein
MTMQKYTGYLNKSHEQLSSSGKQLSPNWKNKEINPGNHSFLGKKTPKNKERKT